MRFVRFGTGIAIGLALGTAAPLMAQWPYFLGPTLSNQTYGVPSGVRVILGCSNGTGYLVQNSVAAMESVPSVIAGVPFTLAAVTCP
jgi:hypothetical protein